MTQIPHTHRGYAYKVQWYKEGVMAWFDVQVRYEDVDEATACARALQYSKGVAVRLMELNLDKGTRTPVAI